MNKQSEHIVTLYLWLADMAKSKEAGKYKNQILDHADTLWYRMTEEEQDFINQVNKNTD